MENVPLEPRQLFRLQSLHGRWRSARLKYRFAAHSCVLFDVDELTMPVSR